jgi:hypothetical protein
MHLRLLLALLSVMLCVSSSFAQKNTYAATESHIGIGVKMSTLGAGIEAAIPITSKANIRGGFSISSYSRGLDKTEYTTPAT